MVRSHVRTVTVRLAMAGVLMTPVLLSAHPAGADPTECAEHHTNETIGDTVHVPSGVACFLDNVQAGSDVVVDPGGFLQTNAGTRIGGSVFGDGASVQLLRTVVAGSVIIHAPVGFPFDTPNGTVFSFPAEVCGSQIGGSIIMTDAPGQPESSGDSLSIGLGGSCGLSSGGGGNAVGGDVIFSNNVSVVGRVSQRLQVGNNAIGGDLVCDGDTPAPLALNNRASATLDQCGGQ
jgi:hypothetical protein